MLLSMLFQEKSKTPMIYILSLLLILIPVLTSPHGHGCGYKASSAHTSTSTARATTLPSYHFFRPHSQVKTENCQSIPGPGWSRDEICFVLSILIFMLIFWRLMLWRMRKLVGKSGYVTRKIFPGKTGWVLVGHSSWWPAQSKCAGDTCSIMWENDRIEVVEVGWYSLIVDRIHSEHH